MDNLSVIDRTWLELDRLESAATALFTGTWHDEESPESLVTETEDNPGFSGEDDVTGGDEPSNGGETDGISRILKELEQFEAGVTELLGTELNDGENRAENEMDDCPGKQSASTSSERPETGSNSDRPETDGSSERPETEGSSERPETDSSSARPQAESSSVRPETESSLVRTETGSSSERPETESSLVRTETESSSQRPENESSLVRTETESSSERPETECYSNERSKSRGIRSRVIFSRHQRAALEESFQRKAYPTVPERKELASDLGLSESQVKCWFQKRRRRFHTRGAYDEAYEALQSQVPLFTTRRRRLYKRMNRRSGEQMLDRNNRDDVDRFLSSANDSHRGALRSATGFGSTTQSSHIAAPNVTPSSLFRPPMAHHASRANTEYYSHWSWFQQYYHTGLHSSQFPSQYDDLPYTPYLSQEGYGSNRDSYMRANCHQVPAFLSRVPSDCLYSYPTRRPQV